MIDFKNTWCFASDENYNALKKINFINFKGIREGYNRGITEFFVIYNNLNTWIVNTTLQGLPYGKQIHLVDGQFQYVKETIVKEKPKNNFKEYGFEADFEGEILKEFDCFFIGWIKDRDIQDNDIFKIGKFLKVNGNFYTSTENGEVNIKKYNLKPIKKEWYEIESKFENYKGKLIINKYGNVRRIQSIDKSKVSTAEQNMYHDILKVDKWRPLTKEEVLSLLIKED